MSSLQRRNRSPLTCHSPLVTCHSLMAAADRDSARSAMATGERSSNAENTFEASQQCVTATPGKGGPPRWGSGFDPPSENPARRQCNESRDDKRVGAADGVRASPEY